MFKTLQTIVKVTAITAVACLFTAAQAHTYSESKDHLESLEFSRVYDPKTDTYEAFKVVQYGYDFDSFIINKQPASSQEVPDASYGHVVTKTERKDIITKKIDQNIDGMNMSFDFISKGLWTTNPNAIFAVMLRASSTGVNNTGAGMLIGNLSGISWSEGGACQGAINTQPAYWYTNEKAQDFGKYWGGSQCGKPLKDNQSYNIYLTVMKNRILYSITDNTTKEKMTYPVTSDILDNGVKTKFTTSTIDQSNLNQPGEIMLSKSTGATFAVVFADKDKTSWNFEISNIHISWSKF